jgi:hypothetical protein
MRRLHSEISLQKLAAFIYCKKRETTPYKFFYMSCFYITRGEPVLSHKVSSFFVPQSKFATKFDMCFTADNSSP